MKTTGIGILSDTNLYFQNNYLRRLFKSTSPDDLLSKIATLPSFSNLTQPKSKVWQSKECIIASGQPNSHKKTHSLLNIPNSIQLSELQQWVNKSHRLICEVNERQHELRLKEITFGEEQCYLLMVQDDLKGKKISQLEKQLKSKNNVLAYMTHHVRTPLNTILCMLDILDSDHSVNEELARNTVLPAGIQANILLKQIQALEIYH